VTLLVGMMLYGGVLGIAGVNDDRGSSSGLLQVHVSGANTLDRERYFMLCGCLFEVVVCWVLFVLAKVLQLQGDWLVNGCFWAGGE
jgi:hypothetical protein